MASLDDERKDFDGMPEKDMVSWTALIMGLAMHQNDRPNDALEKFPRMSRQGVHIRQPLESLRYELRGEGTWGADASSCGVKYGCSSDVYVESAVLDMHVENGKMNEACLVFDIMHLKIEDSWNVLIASYSRKEDGGGNQEVPGGV